MKIVTCLTCLENFDADDIQAFRDNNARKEFSVSGMCQNCQDDLFGGSNEDFGDVNDFKEIK